MRIVVCACGLNLQNVNLYSFSIAIINNGKSPLLEGGRNGKCLLFARLKSFAYLCSEHWEGCHVSARTEAVPL